MPLTTAIQKRFNAFATGGGLTLPVLPDAIARALERANRVDGDLRTLSDAIRRDASLVAHVMRVANTPAYAAAVKIVSLDQAIARLGFTTIKQILLVVASQARVFKAPGFEVEVRAVFAHCLTTALFAQEIAKKRKRLGDEAFTAGLLHDIGKPILMQALVDLHDEERIALDPANVWPSVSASHARVGGALSDRWNLAPRVAEAIRRHHSPCDELSHLVALADRLAHARDAGEHAAVLDMYPEDVEDIASRREIIEATVKELA
jgi:putative nucleotidyltransferase with HDIG domain